MPSALTEDGGLYSAVGTELPSAATISTVAEDVGKMTFRVGPGFTEATVFVRCGALADFAVPAEAVCDDGDAVSADAVGVFNHNAPPTPSATANPPT
jgi:hypothetical protein